ncbi:uncharacterized protein [Clytia hemisphaerica]|uniref:Cnidarian restricted protein n=1 Tax=Clytia hemisphaerica TaxID=252671 RepID=A0A7M5UQB1_9CNID
MKTLTVVLLLGIVAAIQCHAVSSPGADDNDHDKFNEKHNSVDHHQHIIEEVHTERGTAGATSEYSATYMAEKGFQKNYAYGWKTKNNYGHMPEMIWYKFRESFVPAEVTFRSNGNVNEMPTKYQFVGSNDHHCNEYSPWTILCEDLSGDVVKYRYESKRCAVSHYHQATYFCFGLRVLNTKGNTAYAGVGNVRFFKRYDSAHM